MSSALQEKLLIVAACAIAIALVAAGIHSRMAGGSGQPAMTVAAGATEELSNVAGLKEAPPKKKAARAAPTVTPTPRMDCEFLRAAYNITRAERQWVLDNCSFRTKRAHQQATPAAAEQWNQVRGAAGFTLTRPTPSRSSAEAGSTPPPWLSGETAITMARDWLMGVSPVMLTFDRTACVPIWLNGHWVVTCGVGLVGCGGPGCVASLSMCVFTSEPMVTADADC